VSPGRPQSAPGAQKLPPERGRLELVDEREPTGAGVAGQRETIRRGEMHPRVVDGEVPAAHALARVARRVRPLLRRPGEREELALEQRLARRPKLSRPNTVAVISPKGGVGKTTTAFVLSSALSTHLRLRTVVIDSNPDFGTLAALAPESARVQVSMVEVLAELPSIDSAAALRPYVTRLATGLHLLAAPAHPEVMAEMTPELYGRLLDLLRRHYDAIVLDCGTGIVHPIARFALGLADQTVLVSTPEWITASTVMGALDHLGSAGQPTLVLNRATRENGQERDLIESHFGRRSGGARVAIPQDRQLGLMLDSGTYSLEALERPTRTAIKRLAASVGERLV